VYISWRKRETADKKKKKERREKGFELSTFKSPSLGVSRNVCVCALELDFSLGGTFDFIWSKD
jgi:hypothetical protein